MANLLDRILRRKPEIRHSRALTASGQRIDLADRKAANRLRKRRDAWQEESWLYVDAVGEVKNAATWYSNSMSRLRLFAGVQDDPKADPVEDEDPRAVDAVNRLTNPMGGQGEILRTMAQNLFVCGETYLVGIGPRPGLNEEEVWDARSIDELKLNNGRIQITDIPGYEDAITLDQNNGDFLARIWQRHPRYAGKADCSMRGVLNIAEELLLLDRAIRSSAKSRIARSGVMLIANEFSFGNTDPTTDEGGADDRTDPFEEELVDAMMEPIGNEGAASAVVPIILRGPAELIEKGAFKWEPLISPFDPALEARQTFAIRRLAQGLNCPIEIVLGTEGLNHWSAWFVGEDAFQSYLAPGALMIVNGLTASYYRGMLTAAGMAPSEVAKRKIWFDPSKLVTRPDIGTAATTLYEKNELSGETLRRVLGFTEDDRPTDAELVERLLLSGVRIDANIQGQMLRDTIYPSVVVPAPTSGGTETPSGTVTPDPTTPSAKGPPPAAKPTPSAPAQAASGNGKIPASAEVRAQAVLAAARPKLDGREKGRKLLAIDQNLRQRLHAAADAAMNRALEKAGNQIRSRAGKQVALRAIVQTLAPAEVARALGPSLIQTLGLNEHAMLSGAFASLKPRWDAWTAAAAKKTLSILDAPDAEEMIAAAAYERDAAVGWTFLEASLTDLALGQLYNPAPGAPQFGEYDATMNVPYGIVRNAVALAGGASGVQTNGEGGAYVTLDGSAVGGIGTGETAMTAFDGGVGGYEWVYGDFPRTRPFEPHENLDTVEFENFDDPVLANNDSFPEVPFYIPGDHAGCSCDFLPILTPAEEAAQ